jgi:hypothetical protein
MISPIVLFPGGPRTPDEEALQGEVDLAVQQLVRTIERAASSRMGASPHATATVGAVTFLAHRHKEGPLDAAFRLLIFTRAKPAPVEAGVVGVP